MVIERCPSCIGGCVLDEGDRAVCINCGRSTRDDARMLARVEAAIPAGFDLTRPSTTYDRKGPRHA